MSELNSLQLKVLIPSQLWGLGVLNQLTLNFQRVSFILIQTRGMGKGVVLSSKAQDILCGALCCVLQITLGCFSAIASSK